MTGSEVRIGILSFQRSVEATPVIEMQIDVRESSFNQGSCHVMEKLEGRLEESDLYDICFAWKITLNGQPGIESRLVKYFRVYRMGKFLGVTNSSLYFDKSFKADQAPDNQQLEYEIRAIGNDGSVLASCQVQADLSRNTASTF